jgi:hypothetical protein
MLWNHCPAYEDAVKTRMFQWWKAFSPPLQSWCNLWTSKFSLGWATGIQPGLPCRCEVCEVGWTALLRFIPGSPSLDLAHPVDTDRAEELRGLLQEAHQATLREVPSWAYPILIGRQGVFRDGRLLQHIGRNTLQEVTEFAQRTREPGY